MDLKRPLLLLAVAGSVLAGSLTGCGESAQGPLERWTGTDDVECGPDEDTTDCEPGQETGS